MELLPLFFVSQGRIGRLRFWVGWLLLLVLGNGSAMLLREVTASSADPQLIDLLLTVLFVWPDFCVGRKRLADRGKGLAWALVYSGYSVIASVILWFAPFLNEKPDGSLFYTLFWAVLITIALFFAVECGIVKGDEGPNAFGPEPALP